MWNVNHEETDEQREHVNFILQHNPLWFFLSISDDVQAYLLRKVFANYENDVFILEKNEKSGQNITK